MGRPATDMSGQQIGLWTVLARSESKLKAAYWVCRCRCGVIRKVSGSHLRRGSSRGCGCANPRNFKHGESRSREYYSWTAMMARCYNPEHPAYEKYYGGRGVVVCERWHGFENFLADMGRRPLGLSLDRIDPHGNYEPGNCRWATAAEQVNNRR